MQVHEVVHDTALQVALNAVDHNLAADVYELDVRQMLLVLVDGLVDLLVVPNAVAEVLGRHLGIEALVVRARGLDLKDVRHDHVFVVALGLDEDGLDVLGRAAVAYPAATSLCRVGGVEDGDDAVALTEPAEHVADGSLGRSATKPFALRVRRVEEVRRRPGLVGATIRPDIEGARFDRQPCKVPND